MTSPLKAYRPRHSLLAIALAIIAAPAFADTPFSQTVFFGDGFSDAGFFRPLLPASVRPVTGQFTTNPGFVWSQYLADDLGTSAAPNGNGQLGTNYAAGNARVGINSTGALGAVPSMLTQTNAYLAANGGRADPNALYSVWGGTNDLLAILNAGAPAATTITSAVNSEISLVTQLNNAGARYILVSNLTDLGLAPIFLSGTATRRIEATTYSTNYNSALFAGLASNGLRVIPLDTFNLIREIQSSPSAYGFSNVTGTACQPQITANSLICNPTSYITPTAPADYLYADGIYLTSSAHRILADYTLSVLEAPRQTALLPHSAAVVGRARADLVSTHLVKSDADDGMAWWLDVRGNSQRYKGDDAYDGVGPSMTGGLDWNRGNKSFGLFAGLGRQIMDVGSNRGSFDQTDLSLGGFFDWRGENIWANAQLSYTWLNMDVTRNVQLGPATRIHKGSADGSNLSFAVNTGYNFQGKALTHGPILKVLTQRIDIDGYAEDQATLSTSLAYPKQNFDSVIGSLGWQFDYTANEHLAPYARITYDHEFKTSAKEAFAQSQSIVGSLPYAVPGVAFDTNYMTLQFGARTEVFGLDANFGASTTFSQQNGRDTTLFATFGKGF
jgi:outer membrane lipase/esterase